MGVSDEQAAVSVSGLSRSFRVSGTGAENGLLWALRDIFFCVQKGDAVGIIGPNGSGKSTLLRVLAGVTRPTSGSVTLRGRVASILDIGAGFHPDLTGLQNVFLQGAILGFDKAEMQRHLDAVIGFSGIVQFINEPVKNYSNGMYLRLAFSIMAHLPFEVYLLDEVLSVGDAEFRQRADRLLNDPEWRKGRTMLIISHNHNDLLQRCGRSLRLDRGRLVAFGPTEEVLRTYSEDSIRLETNPEVVAPFFRHLRLTVTADGTPVESISSSERLTLELEGERGPDGTGCELGITAQDSYGTILFSISPLQQGIRADSLGDSFRLRCHIPSGLLNEGRLHFTLVGVSDRILFYYRNAAVVRVSCRRNVFTDTFGHPPGVLRPEFPWEVVEAGSRADPSVMLTASPSSHNFHC